MTARAPEFRGLLNSLRGRLDGEHVPFAIGGSFATAARGFVRGTKDIDVMLLLPDDAALGRVHRALLAPPTRFEWMNEVTFRDGETLLMVELLPVVDEAQQFAFRHAELTPLQGAAGIRVLTIEGIILMLLRQATMEGLKNLQRIADVENLAVRAPVDWKPVHDWARRMGYAQAYGQVRAPGKPPW